MIIDLFMFKLFALLVAYQFKHWFADYPLQGDYMLQKFRGDWGFFLPLLAHAGVHGLFTLAIALIINPAFWWLALVDLGIHFVMDRIKASPEMLGQYESATGPEIVAAKNIVKTLGYPRMLTYRSMEWDELQRAKKLLWHNKLFWWFLGLDQMVHHLTHYYIIYRLILP